MCRHVCPIGNATGQERNTARARALAVSVVARGAEKIEDIIDNVYECSLCGACTNNCVTGRDPKIFIQEVKTDAVLNGVIPAYIKDLLNNYFEKGNVYGAEKPEWSDEYIKNDSDTLLIVGQDAAYKSPESVKNVCELLRKAKIDFTLSDNNDTGSALWFLTGATEETQTACKKAAEEMNGYKKIIVYDPVDLAFIRHRYKEFGIKFNAEIIGFNDFVSELINNGRIKVKRSDREYSLQDSYAYARELDDCESGRKLIEKCGINKEMLLIGKEANLAGNLIMNEYMPDVQKRVARDRWFNAKCMDCKTLVTENPAEYEMLKANCENGFRVISIEEMILENIVTE